LEATTNMKNILHLIGHAGIVFICFGFICLIWAIVWHGSMVLPYIQFTLGVAFCATYLFSGGIKKWRSVAVESASQSRIKYMIDIAVYCVLFALVLAMLNYVSARKNVFYFDVTEQKVHTLAPQTIQVVSSLEHPLEISAFFLGGKTDDFKLLDLLQKMSRISDQISWRVVDPEKNPLLVEKYNIKENKTLHFLYRTQPANRETQISNSLNEQAVVNAILKVANSTQRKVYYIVGHGEVDLESEAETGYSILAKSIVGEGVSLETLNLADAGGVPKDADAIILATPQRLLLDNEMQAISEYFRGGGAGIILGGIKASESVTILAKHFGIIVGKNIVVEQIARGEVVMLSVQPIVTAYLPHLVTRGFRDGIVLNLASSVTRDSEFVRNNKGTAVSELALTSRNSWAESKIAQIFGDSPSASFDPGEDIKGPVPVVAAYENSPEGPKSQTRIVVIGDGNFVNNVNIRQLYNRDFFLNVLNWTLGNWNGITIRSGTMRESKKVLTSEDFYYMFVWGVVVIPQAIVLIGLFCWARRRGGIN